MQFPSSTYRIQLHKDFNFGDLKDNIDYLDKFGVGAIYSSPITAAVSGSLHGYDVISPYRINPEIGTLEELKEIQKSLRQKNMLWIQDIVPNHMAFSSENSLLMDVLERSQRSPYYDYFDINWHHPQTDLNGKLMVPFLGKELKECLADGEINLVLSARGMVFRYFENVYPASQLTYEYFLKQVFSEDDANDELKNIFVEIISAFAKPLTLDEWSSFMIGMMQYIQGANLYSLLENAIAKVNSDQPLLEELLELQHYRLTWWKKTDTIINYRRFFTVNSLICLRMESDDVFNDYHKFIAQLYSDGIIQGVRIDHVDGLNDPSGYLKKLRKLLGPDCYIIAEKILEAKEEMPDHWPLEGTSGYEFLSYVNQLYTDRRGTKQLVEFYHSLIPGMPQYEDVVLLNKRFILHNHMAGELDNLVAYFLDLDLQGEFQAVRLREALALVMLCLPVYRTYPDTVPLSGKSLELVNEAFTKALKLNNTFEAELEYLRSLCTTEISGKKIPTTLFLRRFMQFTGPLTAKGVEDTTFYIYNPLISHEEVGDAPSTLGITISEFHSRMIRRQHSTPYSLNATATHDTKRGEDARLRLNLISELPEIWIENVNEWIRINKQFKVNADGRNYPTLNDEYFIYQSILGGFPETMEVTSEWVARLKEYIIKVVREAKVISSWDSPDSVYEDACTFFIDRILSDEHRFVETFLPFMKLINSVAQVYSVAQTVLKITCPGIPDIYQGCELLDLSYVDPDNRRPVDYEQRRGFLQALVLSPDRYGAFTEKHFNEGGMKYLATWKCLQLRRKWSRLFLEGTYLPLALSGNGGLAFAFARNLESDWCVVVVPVGLYSRKKREANGYNDIFVSLPSNSPKRWRNIFTDNSVVMEGNVPIDEILRDFPVAVFVGE